MRADDDAAELVGTRGLVKIRAAIDDERLTGAMMAQGDVTHSLPLKAVLRNRSASRRATLSTSESTSGSDS